MTTLKLADEQAIAAAAQLLQQGGLVAFPTETVYGLGADASNPEAVKRIFAAKGRPANHPLIVHISGSDKLGEWAETIPESAYRLASQFWPGPLALILKKRASVPLEVTGGQDTVALRMPNHPVALQLLRHFGGGIAAPSANRYCRISPTSAQHVLDELEGELDLILDGGACSVGVESTIIDLSGAQPKLLRPGHISRCELEAVLQTTVLFPGAADAIQIRAPGMMEVHYAPKTKALRCSSEQLTQLVEQMSVANKTIGILAYRTFLSEQSNLTLITLPEQADAYAQGLYAALRQLDDLNLDVLLVERPPGTEAWCAINDRLNKATLESCFTGG